MKIGIIGLGYVGATTAACLAKLGDDVLGYDISEERIASLQSKKAPFYEKGLDDILAEVVDRKLWFTSNVEHLRSCDVLFVCVGTPSNPDGSLDLSQLKRVSGTLHALNFSVPVVVRSTVLPGTTEKLFSFTSYAFNPEFLREGSAIDDFYSPAKVIVGSSDGHLCELLSHLYLFSGRPMVFTTVREAELSKYCDNIWHALKVSFSNEVRAICDEFDVDPRTILGLFASDKKLNISDKYLRPGFAYGGSCLSKDLSALLSAVRVPLPLFESIAISNDETIDRAVNKILELKPSSVGIMGLSFKKDASDLRESPWIELANRLEAKDLVVNRYDPYVPEYSSGFEHKKALMSDVLVKTTNSIFLTGATGTVIDLAHD